MLQEEVLYLNGRFLTMDREVPHAEAILVRDGRIVRVGSTVVLNESTDSATRRVDLQGKTAVPGFNDCHCHILGFGLTLDQIDVSADTVHTIAEIQQIIRERAPRAPESTWLIGRGYNQNLLQEHRHPTRVDLDEVSGGQPVVLWHTSGHALTCNTPALQIAGIHAGTRTPPGGAIERDVHGEPTGVFKETPATDLISRVIPAPSLEEGTDAIIRAMEAMARGGITSASDAHTGHSTSLADALTMYRRALESGRLRGRITLTPGIQHVAPAHSDETTPRARMLLHTPSDWLGIGPTKVFSDGALTTRTAALHEPYTDDESNMGLLIWDREILADIVDRAHRAGWSIATHAIGDRAVDMVLECYEQALSRTPRDDHRHRIEHCMMLSKASARRMRDMGVIATIQPGFVTRFGDAYIEALGPDRAADLMPMQTLEQSGVQAGFSSDRPVIPGAPLQGVAAAVSRVTPNGTVLGPHHRISPLQAIRYYTVGSAHAIRAERDRGTLRMGMLADFTVLSRDPRDLSTGDMEAIDIVMTVAGGTETYVVP